MVMLGQKCEITAGKVINVMYTIIKDDTIKESTVNRLTLKIRLPRNDEATAQDATNASEVAEESVTSVGVSKVYAKLHDIRELVINYMLNDSYLPTIELFKTIKRLSFEMVRHDDDALPSRFASIADNQLDELHIDKDSILPKAAIEQLLDKCKSSATIRIDRCEQEIVRIVAKKFDRDVALGSDKKFRISWSKDSETLLVNIHDGYQ